MKIKNVIPEKNVTYSEVKKRIQEGYPEFQKIVMEKFEFLKTEYGFTACDFEKSHSSDLVDKEISILYEKEQIAIKIDWLLVEGDFSILIYELIDGKIPPRDPEKCNPVSFDTFMEYVMDRGLRPVYPSIHGNSGPSKMIKHEKICKDHLETSLKDVIEEYAEKLKHYGNNLLIGDISILSGVQKYQLERFKEDTQ